jgi:hypothetical protein
MGVYRFRFAGGTTLLWWPRLLSKHTLRHQGVRKKRDLLLCVAHIAYASSFEICASSDSFSVFSLWINHSLNFVSCAFHTGLREVTEVKLRVCVCVCVCVCVPRTFAITGKLLRKHRWRQQERITPESWRLIAHLTRRKHLICLLLNLPLAFACVLSKHKQLLHTLRMQEAQSLNANNYPRRAAFCRWYSL